MFVRKAYVTPRPFAEPITVPKFVQPPPRGGEEYDNYAKELLRTFKTTPIINEFENRMTYPDFVAYVASQFNEGVSRGGNKMIDVNKYKGTVSMMRDPEFAASLQRVFNNSS